jgi:hypothetical protein
MISRRTSSTAVGFACNPRAARRMRADSSDSVKARSRALVHVALGAGGTFARALDAGCGPLLRFAEAVAQIRENTMRE